MIRRLEWSRVSSAAGRQQPLVRQAGIAAAILGASAAGTVILAGGRELYLIGLLMAAWCAVSAWNRSSRSDEERRGLILIAAGTSLACAGLGFRFASPAADNRTLELLSHAGTVAALALFILAAIALRPPRRAAEHGDALVLDLVIVTSTLIAALWSLIVSPAGVGSEGLSMREIAALAHALAGGALLLTLVVVGLRLPAESSQRGVAFLVMGLAVVALADLGWAFAWVNGGRVALETSTALLAASFTVLAIALGRERRRVIRATAVLAGEGAPASEPIWRLWLSSPPVLLLSLIVGRSVLGDRHRPTDPVVIVGSLVVIVLVLIRQGIAIAAARRLSAHLSDRADRDPLTNLYNHRKLHDRLEQELAYSRAGDHPIALALIDVDHFKQINDLLGHVVGDHVLKAIAGTLNRACRATDVAARYAGDEFALILPGLDLHSAVLVGERLLNEVVNLWYWPGPDAQEPVSISIGFAVSRAGGRSGRQLVAAADGALYAAKRAGRNRYAVVDADLPEHAGDPNVDLRRLITAHPAG
jgi:diguanylate cyclase (GGDEF)-like protein